MTTPDELRRLVIASGPIYKITLGREASDRAEALEKNVLVFHSERNFYEAVRSEDEAEIMRTAKLLKYKKYPKGNPPPSAHSKWRGAIKSFLSMQAGALVLYWHPGEKLLHWALTEGEPTSVRVEDDDRGQEILFLHRSLIGGWRKTSIGGMPLSNIHPKARELAINMATLSLVQTDPEYFRSLILDRDTSEWESRPEWLAKAKAKNWHPKSHSLLNETKKTPSLVKEAADHFQDEISRIASTAMSTVAYANGQTVLVTVKVKNTNFTQEQLEEEIAALLEAQNNCCGLTGFKFRKVEKNPHLRMSLDRKDSSLGYDVDNLQVVTRAANFFKSASDEADWVQKANAMEHMAIAMQRKRKSELPT